MNNASEIWEALMGCCCECQKELKADMERHAQEAVSHSPASSRAGQVAAPAKKPFRTTPPPIWSSQVGTPFIPSSTARWPYITGSTGVDDYATTGVTAVVEHPIVDISGAFLNVFLGAFEIEGRLFATFQAATGEG